MGRGYGVARAAQQVWTATTAMCMVSGDNEGGVRVTMWGRCGSGDMGVVAGVASDEEDDVHGEKTMQGVWRKIGG